MWKIRKNLNHYIWMIVFVNEHKFGAVVSVNKLHIYD